MKERRSIDEAISIYALEDSIRDIYVEGERDKNFISWFIDSNQLPRTEVYLIDDLDVTNELLEKYNLSNGSNRERVIAAAMAVTECLPKSKNVLFIVDRDYSDYTSKKIDNPVLEYTDYNSIELYTFNEDILCKVLSLCYNYYPSDIPDYYNEMKCVLRKIFAIRLANEILEWNMEWLDLSKYISVIPKVKFQEERFIENYLKKNSMWSKRGIFNKQLCFCIKKLHDDYRLSVRGHDYTFILHCLMNKKFKNKKIKEFEFFEGILLSNLTEEYLLKESMPQKIYNFVNN